jgi:hypothetical protein
VKPTSSFSDQQVLTSISTKAVSHALITSPALVANLGIDDCVLRILVDVTDFCPDRGSGEAYEGRHQPRRVLFALGHEPFF